MLIRPKLEYATIAWNPHKQNNIDTLKKIQRSAARFSLNDHRRKSTTELINKLGWETLETRRIQHQVTFFYKIKQNLININLPQHIITPCFCTRNSNPNINIYAYIHSIQESLGPGTHSTQKSYAYQHYTHSNKPSVPSTLLLQPISPDNSPKNTHSKLFLICTNYYTYLHS